MDKYENACREREAETVRALAEAEELIAKKAGIYSRLLTDMALAEDMEALAVRCGERKKTLEGLAGGGR